MSYHRKSRVLVFDFPTDQCQVFYGCLGFSLALGYSSVRDYLIWEVLIYSMCCSIDSVSLLICSAMELFTDGGYSQSHCSFQIISIVKSHSFGCLDVISLVFSEYCLLWLSDWIFNHSRPPPPYSSRSRRASRVRPRPAPRPMRFA